jgi:alpha-L-rhamnosidase
VQTLATTELRSTANAYETKPLLWKTKISPLRFWRGEKRIFGFTCELPENVQLYVTFDELLEDSDVNFSRLECVNAVRFTLQPGQYTLESFEVYSLRFAKVIAVGGACELQQLYLREYANDDVFEAQFAASDRDLNILFEAACETFRQNAVDVFSDCPSRERAGWLCDSLFTARVALDLLGNTSMERMFVETMRCRHRFRTCRKAFCRCAIPPITMTAITFRTGSFGSCCNSTSTRSVAATGT